MPIPVKDIHVTPARHCPSCGHDVTVQLAYGTFTCPECGETIGWRSAVPAEAPSGEVSSRGRRVLVYSAVVAVLIAVFVATLILA